MSDKIKDIDLDVYNLFEKDRTNGDMLLYLRAESYDCGECDIEHLENVKCHFNSNKGGGSSDLMLLFYQAMVEKSMFKTAIFSACLNYFEDYPEEWKKFKNICKMITKKNK